MAESEQKQLNEAITDGQQQPVADEAGDLVPGGVPPADVVSAPGPTRDSRGKFAAGGTRKGAAGGAGAAEGAADEVSPDGGMLATCLRAIRWEAPCTAETVLAAVQAMPPALQRGVLQSYVKNVMDPEEVRTMLNYFFPEFNKPDPTESDEQPLAARSCPGGTSPLRPSRGSGTPVSPGDVASFDSNTAGTAPETEGDLTTWRRQRSLLSGLRGDGPQPTKLEALSLESAIA